MKKILTTFSVLFLFFLQTSLLFATSNDPFTRTLGEGKIINKTKKNIQKNQKTDSVVPIKTKFKIKPIGNNLSPDPLISYNLVAYRLKGTAMSSVHKMKKISFNRNISLKKIDYGKIPTTHRISKNDSIESIANQYGYLPEEIRVANSFVPGSKLIIGNPAVLPSRFHVVQKNQNLDIIAELYNVESKDLIGINNLKKNYELIINEKLILPFYIYKTEKVQTIQDIAKQFDRTKEEILKINNLSPNDVLDRSQYVKIPIFVNLTQEEFISKKRGIINYTINPRNLAIIEINNLQYMVKEGDLLGNKNGRIVSINNKEMKVLENQEEFVFQINAPITAKQISSLPISTTIPNVSKSKVKDTIEPKIKEKNTIEKNGNNKKTKINSNSTEKTTVTNIEDIFK